MIIKSNPMVSDSNPIGVYDYFATNDKNEDIELLKGTPQDVENCFADGEDFNRKNAMRHFQISSKEPLTDEQFRDAISRIQQEFDIPDEDVVLSAIHTYRSHSGERDPRHGHVGIRLVNSETGQVRRFDNLYQRQEKIARMFEVDNGLALVKGRHNVAVYENVPEEYKDAIKPLTEGPLPNSFVRDGAYQAMKRNGGKPFDIRAEAKEILSRCDNFQSFQNAIQEKGWTIEQGKKKLILNDENGKFVGSLDRILGMKKDEFQQFIDGHEFQVARPTVGGTTTHSKTGEGLHPVEPALETSEKPQEAYKDTSSTTSPNKSQKAPEVSLDSIIAQVDSEKMQASEEMTFEEKQAVSFTNKQESEKDELLKMQLASQKKMMESINMKDNKQIDINDLLSGWNTYIENESQKNKDIIEEDHPTLKQLDDKQVRNFLEPFWKFTDERFGVA
ncbi:relaxase family protein [Gluconobacter oxydans]|uniref:hypothetical protein n=1 Tax=Gluconobacter oxydans TaxID=442 RepID=UPI0026494AC6|nr:hypothetical protein [Gluconobacter oxydans]WKE48023.1 relaxase/mobilization nuclease domain-containing protein [Gluconobacter oxydans]